MFITRNKLLLRIFLSNAKKTIVSEFPTTINTASNTKVLNSRIPSVLEGMFPADNEDVLLVTVMINLQEVL